MIKMKTITINDIEFPKELTLTYGKKGKREWFEWWKSKRGIVIQRYRGEYFYIFIIDDEGAMTYNTYKTATEAVKDLESLGFKVKLVGKNRKIILIKYDNKGNGR
jgi:hypothetical protein